MIKYEFNSNSQILEVFYLADINLTDIIEYGEMIRLNKSLPCDLRILTDATSAIYHLSGADVTELLKVLKVQIEPYDTVKTAVLQQKPVETAISMLVDSGIPIPNYEHKVFSTREAALIWLNL